MRNQQTNGAALQALHDRRQIVLESAAGQPNVGIDIIRQRFQRSEISVKNFAALLGKTELSVKGSQPVHPCVLS